jgi:hypothetical protein
MAELDSRPAFLPSPGARGGVPGFFRGAVLFLPEVQNRPVYMSFSLLE